jgi:hypothetical protein
LENTEGEIKNGHSRETGNIGHDRVHKTKKNKTQAQHNMRWTPLLQTETNHDKSVEIQVNPDILPFVTRELHSKNVLFSRWIPDIQSYVSTEYKRNIRKYK